LLQILTLSADTEDISRKYRLTAKAGENIDLLSATDIDPTHSLENRIKQLAIRRQKGGGSYLKRTSWALYHRAEFQRLINSVVVLIDHIEKLFLSKMC
jgi:hypothetical protein